MAFAFQTNETLLKNLNNTPNLTSSEFDEELMMANSIFMVTIAILSALGIGGNALVCMCLIKDTKLRTMANYHIAHLALVNFTYSVLVLPSHASLLREESAGFACVVIAVFGIVLFMMSLHSQLVISFSRYMLVAKSTEIYRRWFTYKKVGHLLSSFWLFNAVVYLLVPAALAKWRITHLPEHGICLFLSIDYHYTLVMSPVSWLSFVLSLGFYIALIIHVRKNSVTIGQRKRKDIKASMVLLMVMTLYLMTYNILPGIIAVFNDFTDTSYVTRKWINGVVEILQWLNFCVSPIIYGLKIREFRLTYRKLLFPFRKVHPPTVETSFTG